MATLRTRDLRRLRQASLLLATEAPRTHEEVVTWFGAMQAQDLGSGRWSFGVRIPGSTVADVEQATEDRQILRTWPMRGTVHYVPAVDARWMLEVTGVRALAGAARRREHLGLTEAIVEQAVDVLRGALEGGRRLTRAECVALLVDAGVHTAPPHGYHLLWYASQVGVTCIGPQQGTEQTFVLLDEWVPEPRRLERDEALAELARRFVRSHGPVTAKDLAGWTGLPLGDVRRGVAALGDEVVAVAVDGTDHLVTAALLDEAPAIVGARVGLRLLPGFDEMILGYKDRSHVLAAEHAAAVVPGGNGMFLPTIVDDGEVIGTWKRTVRATRVDISLLPFGSLTKGQVAAARTAGAAYAAFLGTEAAFPDLS